MAKKGVSPVRKVKAIIEPLYEKKSIETVSNLNRLRKVAIRQMVLSKRMHDSLAICAQESKDDFPEISAQFEKANALAKQMANLCSEMKQDIHNRIDIAVIEGKYE